MGNKAILGVIALVAVLLAGFVVVGGQREDSQPGEEQMEKKDELMQGKGTSTSQPQENLTFYEGEILAGNGDSPLLDFKKADYDRALAANKVILLYFYANWCPICRVEVPNELYPAFNELTTDKVVGFRVNFNDDQTDADEKTLAQQFGITYQHSKVILKDGKEVVKSLDSWKKSQYLEEINIQL